MPHAARFIAGIAALCAGRAALADRTLTLDDALALAVANNRDLRVAQTHLAEAEAGVTRARAALMPTIEAQGQYTHNYKQVELAISEFSAPTMGLANAIAATATGAEQAAVQAYIQQANAQLANQAPIIIQKQDQLTAALDARLPILAPSAWYGLASAKANARSSAAGYAVTETSVLLAVAQAFYAAAGTDELVVAQTGAVEVADDTYKFAKARVGSELANPVDITRAEAALVRAQQDLVEAQNAQAAAYRSLATLVGDKTETLHVVAPPQQPAEPAPVEQLVPVALQRRPEIAAQNAALAAAIDSSHAGAWRWAPTLSAFANANLFNYTGFSGDKYAWALGLQLDWVIFDGGARDADRAVAGAEATAARAQLSLLHDTISDEVADARDELDTKRKAVEAAQRSQQLAAEALRITRAQWEAGTASQLDLLQAQDESVAAGVALARAHFDLALADVQLRRAEGTFPARTGAAR